MNNIKHALKTELGFTLVELIIGMAIMGIIMSAIVGVLNVTLQSQQYNFDESANIQSERQILSSIGDEIRNATQISSPSAGATVNTITYQKSGDTSNRTIAIGTGSNANTIIFTDTTGTIVKQLGTGLTQSLQFVRDGTITRKFTINLTVRNSTRTNAPSNTTYTIVYTLN